MNSGKGAGKREFKIDRIRRTLQMVLGVVIFYLLQTGVISLGLIIIFGSALGIVFGKVFCRWLCPIGIFMEMLLKAAPDDKSRAMYQYHKLGCPIAWISGLLNRASMFTIRRNTSNECLGCNACDDACYISGLDDTYSLYKDGRKNPADSFTCSRCYACVESCPTNHIEFKVRKF